jgi:hypothetical protein
MLSDSLQREGCLAIFSATRTGDTAHANAVANLLLEVPREAVAALIRLLWTSLKMTKVYRAIRLGANTALVKVGLNAYRQRKGRLVEKEPESVEMEVVNLDAELLLHGVQRYRVI